MTKNVASTPRVGNADIILNTAAEDCERESHPTHPESARQDCLSTDSTGDAVAVIPEGNGSAVMDENRERNKQVGHENVTCGPQDPSMAPMEENVSDTKRAASMDVRASGQVAFGGTLRSGLRQPRTSDIQAGEM